MQHAGELIKFSTLRLNMLMLLMQQNLSKLTATYSQLHASGITYRMLVCRLLRLCFKSVELCYAVRLACPRQVESVLQGDELENYVNTGFSKQLASSARPTLGSAMKKSLVTDSAGWCFSVYSASTRIQNAQTERRKLLRICKKNKRR